MQSSNQRLKGEQHMNNKETMGQIIAAKRKELGMTQMELAERMGVTDKAVSKWERDLSYPDVNSLPKLAEVFGMTVDQLMQIKTESVYVDISVIHINDNGTAVISKGTFIKFLCKIIRILRIVGYTLKSHITILRNGLHGNFTDVVF